MKSLYYSSVSLLFLALLSQQSLASTDHDIFRARTPEQLASTAAFIIQGRVVGSIDYTNTTWPLATVEIECVLKGRLPSQIQLRGLGSHALGTFGVEQGIMFIHECNEAKTECLLEFQGVPIRYTTDEIKMILGMQCTPPDPKKNINLEPLKPKSDNCGEGEPTEWLASVHDASGKCLCNGTLIRHKWILTAAHCVVESNRRPLQVRLSTTTNLAVKTIRIHSKYNSKRVTGHNYDIALLELNAADAKKLPSGPCIPFEKTKPASRAECRVVTATPASAPTTIPFKATVKRQCKDKRLRKSIFSMASSVSADVHSFASPLICRISKAKPWEFYGIGSAAQDCARPGYKAFFGITTPRIGKWLQKLIE